MTKNPAQSLRVIQITDPHLFAQADGTLLGLNTLKSFETTLQHAMDHYGPVDFLLMTGDLTQDSQPGGYRRLAAIMERYQSLAYCLPGNHDDHQAMAEILNTAHIKCLPHFQCNGWRFEMLNTNIPGREIGHLNPVDLDHMEARLRACSLPTVICLHHPPVKIGCAWLDTMMIDNGEQLYQRLQQYPQVRLLLCGHVHQAQKICHHRLTLLTTPSTCIQFKPKSTPFALDNTPPGYRYLIFFEDGGYSTEIARLEEMPHGINFTSTGY